MTEILIVEDEKPISNLIKMSLSKEGYSCTCAYDGVMAADLIEKNRYDLILLDIMLPFFNGYHWCTELRKISNIPIVFVSSASDNMNIVMAMNMGGDDFIAKPVEPSVMIAKIQAILRRTYNMTDKTPVLEHKGAILNLNDTTLLYQDSKIELTKNEFRILQTLLENKGKVVSRDTLMTKLWQIDCYVEENTLTVNVTRLRRKLESAGLTDFIKTKIGYGYIIEL